jgi:hypothetical protein
MIRRMRSEGKDEQRANSSQHSSQPGGGLAMTFHESLRFNALDVPNGNW